MLKQTHLLQHGFKAMLLLALLFNLPAHAGLFDDDEARKAIIELRGRVDIMNRELLARLTAIAERLERLEANDLASQRGKLDQQGQLESMRKELADLRGKIEVQNDNLAKELARTQIQMRDLQGSIDGRFAAIDTRFNTIDTRVKKVEPTFVAVTLDDKQFNVNSEEKARFDAALGILRGGDFRSASVAFTQFLVQYPDSPYSAQAIFWQANSLFGAKDYRAAISANERFLGKYADNTRVPDAILSIGYAQIELNDRRTARTTLQGLVDKHPNSEAAKQAKERLTTLR